MSPMRLAALALLLATALAFLLALSPMQSFDIWWHLRTGRLILEEGRIPRTDPFTYTATGQPWVTHEWLAEVLFYGLYRAGGVNSLVVFKALAAALALLLGALAGLAGNRGREGLPAAALGVLLAAPLIAVRAFERPHLFTALLLGATLLLLRLDSSTGRPLWRRLLPPLFLLWANLHSGFLLGLLLIALYWAGEALSRWLGWAAGPARPAWGGRMAMLGLSLAASLVNPHHVRALLYPLQLAGSAELRESIAELRPLFDPAFRGALFLNALAAAAILLALMFIGPRRRLQGALLLPGLVFGLLALGAVRGVTELAVLLPALFAAHGERLGARRGAAAGISLAVILAAAAGGPAAAWWGVPMGRLDPPRRVGMGVDAANVPAAAVRFLRETDPPGRIFNILAFGSYLIYELGPGRQVYVDGRLDVFPPGFITAYQELMRSGAGWDEAVRRYGIGLALVDYPVGPAMQRGLQARLRQDREWACVFFSDNALVYARRTPENGPLFERFAIPFDPTLRTVASIDELAARAGARDLERTANSLRRMVELAPGEKAPALVLGRLLDRAGRSAEGAIYLRRVAALDPASGQVRRLLEEALRRSGTDAGGRRGTAPAGRGEVPGRPP